MATVVSSASVNQTLAYTQADCGKVAEFLKRGGWMELKVNPSFIDVLLAIAASTDTTDLRTTT